MKDNFSTITVGLLLIIIIGLLAYQFILRSDPNKIRLPLVEGCPLHLQVCSATLPTGGKIFFEINPKQPNPTEVLYLTATFQQFDPQVVQVSFKGKTMNMGYLEYVKYALQRLDTLDESIQFTGKGGLSVCVSGLMEWIVLVNVKADGATYEVPFKLETIYNYN
jgi:hypothetical protein